MPYVSVFGATKLSMWKLCFHFSFFSNFNGCANTKHFENGGCIYQQCVAEAYHELKGKWFYVHTKKWLNPWMNNKLTWQLGGMGWFVHKQFTHVRYVRTTLCVSSQTTLNYESTLPFICASMNKSTEKSSINAVTHTPFATAIGIVSKTHVTRRYSSSSHFMK